MNLVLSSHTIAVLCGLFFFHWVADFLAQTSWMALNKSEKFLPLFVHCIIYGVAMYLFGWCISLPLEKAIVFGLLNGVLHFGVDWCTSKATHYIYKKKGASRIFFNIIGFDQFVHAVCLLWTLWLFSSTPVFVG